MKSPQSSQVDASVQAAQAAGELGRAVTEIMEAYGAELRHFFRVRLRGAAPADEAFAIFAEDLWRGFPSFRWRSSLRTWLYAVARHSLSRHLAARRRAPVLLATTGAFTGLPEGPARESTDTFLRTDTKQRVRALRDELSEDDQTLLVLRVDRGLSWRELAVVLGEAAAEAPEAELVRASARMRTRFQTAKQRLRKLAYEAGLTHEPTDEGSER